MSNLINEFKEKISKFDKFPFLIKDHARIRSKQRGISLDETLENIINNKYLINVDKQNDNKYKISYQKKGSQKYIYIIKFKSKHIEIITLWKELSKLQKQINKKWKRN